MVGPRLQWVGAVSWRRDKSCGSMRFMVDLELNKQQRLLCQRDARGSIARLHTCSVSMLVVPVPDPDPGTPLQGVPGVEAAAEDPVGGGEEGDREVEGPVEDQGPPGGREVQAAGTGFLLLYGRGSEGAASGKGWLRQSGVRVGDQAAPGAGRGTGGGGRGAGCCGRIGCRGGTATVPAHAVLHGIGRRGVGDGLLLSFVVSLVRTLSSWDRPARRAKGSLQRAASARTADRKTG